MKIVMEAISREFWVGLKWELLLNEGRFGKERIENEFI